MYSLISGFYNSKKTIQINVFFFLSTVNQHTLTLIYKLNINISINFNINNSQASGKHKTKA